MRRAKAAVLALAAIVGLLATTTVLVLRERSAVAQRGEREPVAAEPSDRTAPPIEATALDGTPEPARSAIAPKPVAGERAPTTRVIREIEPVASVAFPGLILVSGPKPDDATEEGRLVLRNADPTGRPQRFELAVHDGRFEGKGPINAVVTVESLELGGRRLATRDGRWKLADRWIELHASYARLRRVHVVDADDGRELEHVRIGQRVHDEGAPDAQDAARIGVPVLPVDPERPDAACLRERLSDGGPDGFHSPLWTLDRSFDAAAESRWIVRAPAHGDELVALNADSAEVRIALHAPARLRVHLATTPAPARPEGSRVPTSRPSIAAGLVVDAQDGGKVAQEELQALAALPRGLRVGAEAAIARGRRRTLAQGSPMIHRAVVDESGSAVFDDLCAGRWLVWQEDPSNPSGNVLIEVAAGRAVYSDFARPLPSDPIELRLASGDAAEVELEAPPAPPQSCRTLLTLVDGKTGEGADLPAASIDPCPLDRGVGHPGFFERHATCSPSAVPGKGQFVYELPAGFLIVHVSPPPGSRFATCDRIFELPAPEGEIAIKLPLRQGIDVVVAFDHDTATLRGEAIASRQNVLPPPSPGLDGEEPGRNGLWFVAPDGRMIHSFDRLPPGVHQLLVPDGCGFARPGPRDVEVKPDEVTTVELEWTPPDLAGGGR
jgi:hypothetical protein